LGLNVMHGYSVSRHDQNQIEKAFKSCLCSTWNIDI